MNGPGRCLLVFALLPLLEAAQTFGQMHEIESAGGGQADKNSRLVPELTPCAGLAKPAPEAECQCDIAQRVDNHVEPDLAAQGELFGSAFLIHKN